MNITNIEMFLFFLFLVTYEKGNWLIGSVEVPGGWGVALEELQDDGE